MAATLCGQGDSVSKGVRRTKTMGDRRIRLCRACKRKFTPKGQRPADAAAEDSTDADMLASQIEAAEPELNQRREIVPAPDAQVAQNEAPVTEPPRQHEDH